MSSATEVIYSLSILMYPHNGLPGIAVGLVYSEMTSVACSCFDRRHMMKVQAVRGVDYTEEQAFPRSLVLSLQDQDEEMKV